MSDAPKRLLDELEGGPLRGALEAGVRDLPDEAALASLAAKLGLGAAVVGGVTAAGAGAAGAGGASSAGAGAAGAGGASGAGVGAAVAGSKLVVALKLVTALAVAGGGAAGVYEVTRDAPRSAAVGLVATASASASSPSGPSAAPPASPSVSTDVAPAPSASASPSAAPVRPATGASARASATGELASDPAEEARLLARAQDAIATDPARSLSVTTEHATRFPRGALAQEREVLAVDALVRLGRTRDAEARARAFRAAYPTSGHLRRLDALLAKPVSPAGRP